MWTSLGGYRPQQNQPFVYVAAVVTDGQPQRCRSALAPQGASIPVPIYVHTFCVSSLSHSLSLSLSLAPSTIREEAQRVMQC